MTDSFTATTAGALTNGTAARRWNLPHNLADGEQESGIREEL
jgi:hypothetical protein